MRLALDANVFVSDWMLRSAAIKSLLSESRKGRLVLLVPQVAFDEAVNKHRETVRDDVESAKSSLATVERLDPETGDKPPELPEPHAVTDRYRHFLTTMLEGAGARFLPYPPDSHEVVTSRALDRRKPFDANGQKGYRDTLIWLTLLAELGDRPDDGSIGLITTNSGDFAASKQEPEVLHPHLAEDLDDAGWEDGPRVLIYNTPRSFVQRHVEPAENLQAELRERLTSDPAFASKLEALVLAEAPLQADLSGLDLDHVYWPDRPIRVDEVVAEEFFPPSMMDITDVRPLGDGEYLVTVYAEGDADLYVSGRADSPWDRNWESSSPTSVTITKTVWMEFEATYNETAKDFTDALYLIGVG